MKEINLKSAQSIIATLEVRRKHLEYLQDSRSTIEVSLHVQNKGSVCVSNIEESSTMAIKAILIVEVQKSIQKLELELTTL